MEKYINKNESEELMVGLEKSVSQLIISIKMSDIYHYSFQDENFSENHYIRINFIEFEKKIAEIEFSIKQIKKIKKIDLNNSIVKIKADFND